MEYEPNENILDQAFFLESVDLRIFMLWHLRSKYALMCLLFPLLNPGSSILSIPTQFCLWLYVRTSTYVRVTQSGRVIAGMGHQLNFFFQKNGKEPPLGSVYISGENLALILISSLLIESKPSPACQALVVYIPSYSCSAGLDTYGLAGIYGS